MPAAMFKEFSLSHKLSPTTGTRYVHPGSGWVFMRPRARPPYVSATFASIAATCPDSCPLKGGGCYAQTGFQAPAVRKMDAAARGLSGVEVIEEEAALIRGAFRGGRVPQDGARGGRDLRLHVAGDVPRVGIGASVAALAGAAEDWLARGGGSVFTYTHQWRSVRRGAWGPIAVLASCDYPNQVAEARRAGYPAALVVAEFPGRRAWSIPRVPGRVVPCPAQTGDATCAECRLCLDRDLVKLGVTVAFAAHGVNKGKIQARAWSPSLRVLS